MPSNETFDALLWVLLRRAYEYGQAATSDGQHYTPEEVARIDHEAAGEAARLRRLAVGEAVEGLTMERMNQLVILLRGLAMPGTPFALAALGTQRDALLAALAPEGGA